MRLIDADELKQRIAFRMWDVDDDCPHDEGTIRISEDWAIDALVDKQPTVEAVPVVHGHWIDTGKSDDAGNSFYMCSVCGCGENHYPIVEVPYCWKCGAKMDEVRE